MDRKEKNISIQQIKEAFNKLFPKGVKSVEIKEEEEVNTFIFELEFVGEVRDLLIPDGIFISYIHFADKFIEGFIDGVSFLEFVKENNYHSPL